MNHDELQELLGAYALDAVDGDERALVEAHLTVCARCRAEVEEHREVAALLAHSGSAAPDGLWERIAGSLEEAPPGLRLAPVGDRPPRSPDQTPPVTATGAGDAGDAVVRPLQRRGPSRLMAAALAAAAVLAVVLGIQVRSQDQRIDELQTALQDPMLPAFQTALDDPRSQVFELTSADGQVVLRGALTPDGTGYLRAQGLPRLPGDRTYQLWGAAGDELVSLGVLGTEPGIVVFPAASYSLFAITEEAAPGVVVSANPPVVAGSLS
jgi:hypothetical protein